MECPSRRRSSILPAAVDPGDHAVVVSTPGRPSRTFTAHVGPESPAATVRIDALGEAAPEPVPTPLPTPLAVQPSPPPNHSTSPSPVAYPVAPPPSRGLSTGQWLGLGVGGVGVVGVAAGSVFGMVAKSKLSQSNAGGCNATTDYCTTQGLATRQDAVHAATASDLAFALGGSPWLPDSRSTSRPRVPGQG